MPQELATLRVGAVKDVLRHGTVIYLAPVSGGVLAVDAQNPAAPVITARFAEGRHVVQLAHEGASTLVAILDDRGTLSFDASDPLHPISSEAAARSRNPYGGKGSVLAVKDGAVVIQGGSAAGFHVGEHVKILSRSHLSPQDLLAEQEGLEAVGATTAIVALERVEANRSLAHLGRGDEAQPGDEVVGTGDQVSESIFGPRWIPFQWRLAFTLRAFLDTSGDNSDAVGFLGDVMVSYYFPSAPIRIEAGVEPVGWVWGGSAQHNPAIAVLDVAYSSAYFEFGIGTGFSVLANNSDLVFSGQQSGGSQVNPLIVEVLRIGQIDGVNATWHSAIASTSSQGFQLRAAELDLNIPIATRVTLYMDGGGGNGFAFGDLGIRTYLGGLGGPGTCILSLGVGGAAILDGYQQQPSGPSLMAGIEFRL